MTNIELQPLNSKQANFYSHSTESENTSSTSSSEKLSHGESYSGSSFMNQNRKKEAIFDIELNTHNTKLESVALTKDNHKKLLEEFKRHQKSNFFHVKDSDGLLSVPLEKDIDFSDPNVVGIAPSLFFRLLKLFKINSYIYLFFFIALNILILVGYDSKSKSRTNLYFDYITVLSVKPLYKTIIAFVSAGVSVFLVILIFVHYFRTKKLIKRNYYQSKKYVTGSFSIRVWDLPSETTENELMKYFSKYGEIHQIELCYNIGEQNKTQKRIRKLENEIEELNLRNNCGENMEEELRSAETKLDIAYNCWNELRTKEITFTNQAIITFKTLMGSRNCKKQMRYGIWGKLFSKTICCFSRFKRRKFMGKKINVGRAPEPKFVNWNHFENTRWRRNFKICFKTFACIIIIFWNIVITLSIIYTLGKYIKQNEELVNGYYLVGLIVYVMNEILEWIIYKMRNVNGNVNKEKKNASLIHFTIFAKGVNSIFLLNIIYYFNYKEHYLNQILVIVCLTLSMMHCVLDPVFFFIYFLYIEKKKIKNAHLKAKTSLQLKKGLMPRKVWLSKWYIKIIFSVAMMISTFCYTPISALFGFYGIMIYYKAYKVIFVHSVDFKKCLSFTETIHKRVLLYLGFYFFFTLGFYSVCYSSLYFKPGYNAVYDTYTRIIGVGIFYKLLCYRGLDPWKKKLKFSAQKAEDVNFDVLLGEYHNPYPIKQLEKK
ncbi:putative transmembrane protein [Anaeramoeba flamelloides]|uniref:Transmembrane protein n=1 Tax=Anaeramoeba flamelloides TaxID=1746091 RepID=A0ABQ8ZCC9_9EUKA|nr:putative transmembrane protein [Anaeramoeba flamelloides]